MTPNKQYPSCFLKKIKLARVVSRSDEGKDYMYQLFPKVAGSDYWNQRMCNRPIIMLF